MSSSGLSSGNTNKVYSNKMSVFSTLIKKKKKKYGFTFSNSTMKEEYEGKRIIGNHKSRENTDNIVHVFSSDVLFYVRADSLRQF